MLKHGIISDAEFFKNLSKYKSFEENDVSHLIHRSVSIKNSVVTRDPLEKNLRKIINFGHTLVHAIESYFLVNSDKKSLLHGEAIAIGMILEAYLSSRMTGLSIEAAKEIKSVFLSIFPRIQFNEEEKYSIMALLKYDKKNSHGKVNFVLLEAIGKPIIDIEVGIENFSAAFDFYKAD